MNQAQETKEQVDETSAALDSALRDAMNSADVGAVDGEDNGDAARDLMNNQMLMGAVAEDADDDAGAFVGVMTFHPAFESEEPSPEEEMQMQMQMQMQAQQQMQMQMQMQAQQQ